jgi:hypothetical protein
MPPEDTSNVRTSASADRQPAAHLEVGIAEHAFGWEAGKACLILSGAGEESPEYRDTPFGRLAFRCRLKEIIPGRRL